MVPLRRPRLPPRTCRGQDGGAAPGDRRPKPRPPRASGPARSPAELAAMKAVGVTTFLFGEALMSQHDVRAATAQILGQAA